MSKIIAQIAAEIKVSPSQVQAAVDLLDGGATVPFVARYRKEATGGLDDIYLRELQARRDTVLKSIQDQGKLTDELRLAIEDASTKQDLEDLYLPFKPKRRTKGMMAREAGIEPLADALFADPSLVPVEAAKPYVRAEKTEQGDDFTTVQAVLDGVRDILPDIQRWTPKGIDFNVMSDRTVTIRASVRDLQRSLVSWMTKPCNRPRPGCSPFRQAIHFIKQRRQHGTYRCDGRRHRRHARCL